MKCSFTLSGVIIELSLLKTTTTIITTTTNENLDKRASKQAAKMNYILTFGFFVLWIVAFADGQRFAPGYCPQVPPVANFDKSRFFGRWIEAEKTPSIFDLMMRCMTIDYSDDNDGSMNVVVRGVSLAGLPLSVNGDGLLVDPTKKGHYSIRYGFGMPFQGTLSTIVDTDYTDYAVVYSCTNSLLSGVFHSEYIWLLTRDGTLSNPTRQNVYEKLDKYKINRAGLAGSDRSACPANYTGAAVVAREADFDLAGPTEPAAGNQVILTTLSP